MEKGYKRIQNISVMCKTFNLAELCSSHSGEAKAPSQLGCVSPLT